MSPVGTSGKDRAFDKSLTRGYSVDLRGVYPALTTPFASDGSVSIPGLKRNIQRYNTTGLTGYLVLGSTGESVLLSKNEADEVLAAAKEAAGDGKILLAGTGAESTAETVEKTKRAADLGYHAALVKTPHYYKPVYKPDVLIAHYQRVADASPIPVLLYSVPQFTGITLETPEILALAKHPNIIGIKDSSGSVQRVGEMAADAPTQFQILVGSAAVAFPSLVTGARGVILALGSALPEMSVALFDFVSRGEIDKARELQLTMVRASKLIVAEHGIAGVKFAMDQRGYHGGIPRLPLQPLSDSSKRRISDLLATLEPAMASSR
jgi:4-hydroxy-2-oxoglutarate aldolase